MTSPVVVAGHICVDLVPSLGSAVSMAPGRLHDVGPLSVRAGGCVANTGGDLAALGVPTRLVADIGDDRLGQLLSEMLAVPNVDASGVRRLPGRRTSYSVVCEPPGTDRTFWHHVGANEEFDGALVEFDGADLLHVGYPPLLPALCEGTPTRLGALLATARQRGLTTSVDMATIDPTSQAAEHDWAKLLAVLLPLVDVFTPSLDDLNSVLGRDLRPSTEAIKRLGEELIGLGTAVVLIKLGAAGLYLRTAPVARLADAGRVLAGQSEAWADRELWAPALDVDVIGTTGAGDAAVAGLLYGLVAGHGPIDALTVGSIAAAARISTKGPLAPWSELLQQKGRQGAIVLTDNGWVHDGGAPRGPDDARVRELEHAE